MAMQVRIVNTPSARDSVFRPDEESLDQLMAQGRIRSIHDLVETRSRERVVSGSPTGRPAEEHAAQRPLTHPEGSAPQVCRRRVFSLWSDHPIHVMPPRDFAS